MVVLLVLLNNVYFKGSRELYNSRKEQDKDYDNRDGPITLRGKNERNTFLEIIKTERTHGMRTIF